ncbi:Thioredoxin family signature [Acididesulfobacillus acetoxydans]|uniref:Thioredoxin n=1 Tax=Acididesulfobacillus acetoxydans TaxID=1561005 RepID=A0A8S0WP64_9FIRM|nr:thioredoxin [Acididesulfobacillus acetoxydans]CAA7601714.1 Thioredoxin family signature [Acididesulfobacillus acetoxydans]CEJ09067.1 Thioredoxin [Acididesulfobacillus acetoxydans]
MAGLNIKTLTAGNWDTDVLKSEKPVLVDFWAAWCAPCRMVAPIVEELSNEYAGRVVVGKLDVDANGSVASQYGVMSIPTLGVFKGGKMVDKIIGFRSKGDLVKMLDRHA